MLNITSIDSKSRIAWVVFFICISGCSDSKTVEYYYNHVLEAREKYKECQKKEGGFESSEACMNATQVIRKWSNTIHRSSSAD